MSEIDPEKLEVDIKAAEDATYGPKCTSRVVSVEMLRGLIAAARAHLATLPRYKEVEVEAWVLLTSDGGDQQGWTNCKEQADEWRRTERGAVVRLTGTAKVKVMP